MGAKLERKKNAKVGAKLAVVERERKRISMASDGISSVAEKKNNNNEGSTSSSRYNNNHNNNKSNNNKSKNR